MAFGFENELRAENDRLRNQLEEAVGKAAWHYENLTLLEEKMVERNAEIARRRLTDAEREAIKEAADSYDDGCNERCREITKIFRGLLERLK